MKLNEVKDKRKIRTLVRRIKLRDRTRCFFKEMALIEKNRKAFKKSEKFKIWLKGFRTNL